MKQREWTLVVGAVWLVANVIGGVLTGVIAFYVIGVVGAAEAYGWARFVRWSDDYGKRR